MKRIIIFFTGLLILSFSYGQIMVDSLQSTVDNKNINNQLLTSKIFPSVNSYGVIGEEESRPDNPSDNIFHVRINETLNSSDKAWLVYDLDGVEDHASVSRSINDQLSVGGYFVKAHKGFTEQKERINPKWLKEGDNIVRFTISSEALYYYKIKNLRIEVEPVDNRQIINEEPLSTDNCQLSIARYGEFVYVKGWFLKYENISKLLIDGTEVNAYNGEFERVLKGSKEKLLVEAILENGESISKEINLGKTRSFDYQFSFSMPEESYSKYFKKEEKNELSLNNTYLIAPSDALKKSANVSITPLREIDIPTLDAGMVNVTGGAAGYRFLPHHSLFDKDLILEMGYDPAKVPGGFTAKDIRTYYFDEKTHHWVALPYDSSDAVNYRVHARTSHFTDIINAIIKVPESPESEAYNPTSMKGIKAANPTAGINLIDPPSANNMGTANLSYPINIPAGRNGMEPQLGVGYNSGGGNGWLGLGWNLQMPSVSIETRWGVPRYSSSEETETYLLNGEQLTPLAHRATPVARTSEKQFYERVEGSFHKIIRHGSDPKNYWWEVTDKNGTRYFYGGRPEGGLSNNAVLTDASGNIGHWCLLEIRDLNGNNVRYQYTTVIDKGMVSGSVDGKQIYISRITYTGSNGSDGRYSVDFIRDRMLNETRRSDVIISANLGFKEVTADLLRKIVVSFNSQPVRTYELVYNQGAFLKTLLHKIREFDASGNFFNEHEFSYYDDVRSGGSYQPFGSEETWNPRQDDVKGNFILPPVGEFNDKASALNGTKSTDAGFGLAVTVGANNGKLWSKTLSAGGNFGFAKATSDGILALVDLDGDGLPDKVMMQKDKVTYRPNLSGTTDNKDFGDEVQISVISGFLKEKSTTVSAGVEANGPNLGGFSAFAGFSESTTKTKTTVFFTDANGDQLIDVVVDKTVYFNHLVNGVPSFEASSTNTPSPIFEGGTIDPNLFQFDEAEFEASIDKNPLQDIVKMWEAPCDGIISIDAPVSLIIPTNDPDWQAEPVDGVRVAIQHNDNEVWHADIKEKDDQVHIPDNVSAINVNKGDRIYFRVQSEFNGAFDQVNWDPKIEYTNHDAGFLDPNGKKTFSFKASEDFVISSHGETGFPISGVIRMQGSFNKPVTTDNIHAIIQTTSGTVLWERYYTGSAPASESYDFTATVNGGDGVKFLATTETNIIWSSIVWDNHMYYIESHDPNVTQVFAADGSPLIEAYPTPSFSIFAEPTPTHRTYRAPSDGNVTITPVIEFNSTTANGNIVFSVKRLNELVAKKTLHVSNSVITDADPTLSLPVTNLEEIYIEFHTTDKTFSDLISKHDIEAKFEKTEVIGVNPVGSNVTWTAYDLGTVEITPVFEVSGSPSGKVVLTVTNADGTVTTKTYDVPLVAPIATITVNVDSIEMVNLKYDIQGSMSNGSITSAKAQLYFVGIKDLTAPHSALVQDLTFGPFYRQWGHFAYNGNRDRATAPIDQSLLHVSGNLDANANSNDNLLGQNDLGGLQSSSSSAYDPAKENFIVLVPDSKNKLWQGYDNLVWLKANEMSSSRMGQDDLTQDNPLPGTGGGTGLKAINKMTKSNTTSWSVGAGFSGGFSVSGSYSQSFGKVNVLADYVDMNGDRYPDILTENSIQYSNPFGGMSSLQFAHNIGSNHFSKNEADGVTLGGNFVVAESKNESGNVKKTKTHVGGGKVSVGVSGSASYAKSSDDTEHTWSDINGDGLPDYVFISGSDLYVRLNLGYSLAAEEKWDVGQIAEGASTSISGGAGLGVNIDNCSISAGFGLSKSDNNSKKSLQDVNGDGLSDLLLENGSSIQAMINTGNGFVGPIDWAGAEEISTGSNVTESANVGFTFCFPILAVKLCVNASVNAGHGASKVTSEISDVNGDGFPDYLTSDPESGDGDLKVSLSTIGRTNMLKSISRPLGATISMDYKREGNTYNMPNDVWALSKVEVYDGFNGDGVDVMKSAFVYEDGFYDRNEREFYGFTKVETKALDTKNSDALYRQITEEFENSNYYEKGLLLSETLADKDGNLFSEKKNTYTAQDALTGNPLSASSLQSTTASIFPALTKTESFFYEGQPQVGKSTSMTYRYDQSGNLVEYNDFGDVSSNDNLKAEITYHQNQSNYLIGIPKSITVTGGDGKLYRKRTSDVDLNTGNLIGVKQFLEDGSSANFDMEYNSYGNLTKITRPTNAQGQRFSLQYTYDSQVSTYIVKRQNSYGYTSTCNYDFRFGEMLESVDINGQKISYEIDDKGRITKIKGPYEQQGNGYTLKFTYNPDATVPWALTDHFDPQFPNNTLQTAIFVDGLGRVLQTKKDGALYMGEHAADQEAMIVSGRVLFDAFGRTTTAYYPITETIGNAGTFNPGFDTQQPTTTDYDVLDRAVKITLPDGAVTTTAYGFENDRDGTQQFSTLIIDANGIKTEQFTDVRGRVTATKNYLHGAPVWTSFVYDAINELVTSANDLGHVTTHEYDMLGRKVKRVHPDAGETTYKYDLSSNLTSVQTANLKKTGGEITYSYDFERLKSITYPDNPQNNVSYTYGDANAKDNRIGRVILQEDVTGAQEFFYGPLGEVVKNIRTVMIPGHEELTFTTEFTYDTWNRLTQMIYPDGEKVTYAYNAGGLLQSMKGAKSSANFQYVDQLGYDKFEQRVFLAYGNGTKTTYSYEADRRRLKNMTAETSGQRVFMDNNYTYDKVNNILSLENNAPVPSSNLMGGSSKYIYKYDDLYRLTSADGIYTNSTESDRYNMQMEYNNVGGITKKQQTHEKSGGGSNNWVTKKKTTYTNAYDYGNTDHPNAASHIGEKTYSYDANGNQTGWDHDISGQRRTMIWDEENRLMTLSDNGSASHYFYDAQGIRVLKSHGGGQSVHLNAKPAGGDGGGVGNFTVYVNPYLVLQSGSYTKHFFIESQRMVSKLGDTPNLGKATTRAGEGQVNYTDKRGKIWTTIVKNLKFLGDDGEILTAGKSGKVPPGQVNGTSSTGSGQNEKFQFFYHPDHVGSTSYITDASGEVYQHLEYFAFGETFVEEHSNTNRTPYLFNGKELDDETGLYYYGARYYDPVTSVWQSVDPLADRFPGVSGYVYCYNNPTNFSDPFGLEGKKPNLLQRFKAAIGIGRITGSRSAGNQRYVKNRNWSPSDPAPRGGVPAGGNPAGGGTATGGGGVGAGQTIGGPGNPGPNPRTPANQDGVQSRLNLQMQLIQLPGAFTNGNSSNYTPNARMTQIGNLYNDLSRTVNRDAYNVEALEVHIYVGINPAMVGSPYTLSNGTVLAAATANQILDDRASVIRASLLRLGIPNDKIIWNRATMGGVSGGPLLIPATMTGRFPGAGFVFPAAPATTHGVVFR